MYTCFSIFNYAKLHINLKPNSAGWAAPLEIGVELLAARAYQDRSHHGMDFCSCAPLFRVVMCLDVPAMFLRWSLSCLTAPHDAAAHREWPPPCEVLTQALADGSSWKLFVGGRAGRGLRGPQLECHPVNLVITF